MPNSNYAQVSSLLAQGKLRWQTDAISTCLLTGATFNAAHKALFEAGGEVVSTVGIPGRSLSEDGAALGQAVVFPAATKDTDYQVVIVQLNGVSDPVLLAWIDENEAADSISVERDGTLIVRPVETDDELPPHVGVWMRL